LCMDPEQLSPFAPTEKNSPLREEETPYD